MRNNISGLWIRFTFDADPDQALYFNADPDPSTALFSALFRIRIHWLWIRISILGWIPVRICIYGFDDHKLKKIYSWKNLIFLNFFIFLWVILPSWILIHWSGSATATSPICRDLIQVGVNIQVEAQHLSLLGREWKDRQREREEAYQLRLQASCTKVS